MQHGIQEARSFAEYIQVGWESLPRAKQDEALAKLERIEKLAEEHIAEDAHRLDALLQRVRGTDGNER